MYQLDQTIKTSRLFAIACDPSTSLNDLEDIISILQERKNSYAFRIMLYVDKLIERRQEEKRKQNHEQRHIERRRLKLLNQAGYFEWPSTDAPASIHGFSGDKFFYKDGLLSYVGYKVGRKGIVKHIRLQILDCVFHNQLPNVHSLEYMDEWGFAKTSPRLRKIAESLAAFTRNAKRRKNADNSQAILDWESDLEYLYYKYYIGKFGFAWPDSLSS